MTTTKLRFILTAALAILSLAAATAHAQPGGVSSSSSSSGKGCMGRGGAMDDGEVDRYHGKYENSTQTCTNGEVCTSTGVLQINGTRSWTYECHNAPIDRLKSHVTLRPTGTAQNRTTR